MLLLEAQQIPSNKSQRNALLRSTLKGRSKGSVEMKHQNVSAVLDALDLPFIPGYKPRNGSDGSSFIVSRNELDFSKEAGPAFHLYRVFQFREAPRLYMLRGDLSKHVQLEPIDYRASFRKLI
jgi:hypothetical protein